MEGRRIFSASEKVCLQRLVFQYRLNSTIKGGRGDDNHDKKTAWERLTQEFNSIETNSARTAVQLKKCWDNIKSRKKQAVARKRELACLGALTGSYTVDAQNLDGDPLRAVKAEDLPMLLKDDEVQSSWVSDCDNDSVTKASEVEEVTAAFETSPHKSAVCLSVNGTSQSEAPVNKNRIQEREEELHEVKMAESAWMLKTLKEKHRTAQLERQIAQLQREKAQLERDKAQLEREKAQLQLNRAKREAVSFIEK